MGESWNDPMAWAVPMPSGSKARAERFRAAMQAVVDRMIDHINGRVPGNFEGGMISAASRYALLDAIEDLERFNVETGQLDKPVSHE